jgi:DNA-binding transcriptional ArsR family regulator
LTGIYLIRHIPAVASTFDVIAEPSRRRILDLLRVHRRSVGELVDALDMTQPQVSKHLRVLKTARLVEVQAEAQQRFYEVRVEPLRELEAWLAPYRRLWNARLDALERRLDEMPDEATPKVRARAKTEAKAKAAKRRRGGRDE